MIKYLEAFGELIFRYIFSYIKLCSNLPMHIQSLLCHKGGNETSYKEELRYIVRKAGLKAHF